MPALATHTQVDQELVIESVTFEDEGIPRDAMERVKLQRAADIARKNLAFALRVGDPEGIRTATAAVAIAEELQQLNEEEDRAHLSMMALHRLHRRTVVTFRDLPPAA